jgi:hypothetical protein
MAESDIGYEMAVEEAQMSQTGKEGNGAHSSIGDFLAT